MPSRRLSEVVKFVIGDKAHPWGGLNTATKDPRSLDRGETFSAVNWITGRDKDNIQIRRGQALLGTTRRASVGVSVSGMGIGTLANGSQVPFFSAGRKLYYYNGSDTVEVTTTDLFPVAAAGDDVNIVPYSNLAGSFVYVTSPNSSIYKIPVANPGSVVNQNSTNKIPDYRFGWAKIDNAVFQGMQRNGQTATSRDPTGFYFSRVDQNGAPNGYPQYMALPAKPAGTVTIGVGAMTDGTYYYVITALNSSGVETTKGAESNAIVISGGGGVASINLSWAGVAGATGYKIYRTTSTGVYTTPAFIATVNAPITTYQDAAPLPSTGAPPATTTVNLIGDIATGDGSTKTFTGTLPSFSAGLSTVFGVQITDGVELFSDDKNGNLVGSLGGTGTINYATGVYSVTFVTAPVSGVAISASYFFENATVGGIMDFTINGSDATGTYAQVFRQDDGGGSAMGAATFQGVEYCFHLLRSWLNQTTTQTDGSRTYQNIPYWSQIGIPYPRAFFETGDGVLYLDNTNPQNPKVSILEIPPGSTNLTVVPVTISLTLDLSGFAFDKAVMYRWGEYNILECQSYINGHKNSYNSVTFVQNIYSGLWNQLDYDFTCLGNYLGTLVSGDSLSPNAYTLFSGFDDDGSVIANYWNTSYSDLEMEGIKKCGYLKIRGLIQPTQRVDVNLSLDFGNYVNMYTIVGNAGYVNKSNPVGIGTFTIGSQVIGGDSSQQFANPFEIWIPVHTDLFEYISTQVQALDVGFIQIDEIAYVDIRKKRDRPLRYSDPAINNNN